MILGLAPGRLTTTVVAVRDGVPVSSWSLPGTADTAFPATGALDALAEALPDSSRAIPASGFSALGAERPGEIRAACVAMDLDAEPTAPVAAIRVGGPCPPALAPHVPHPQGAATIVRGGHSLTGRPLAALDTDAVRAFAAGCGLVDFAVTATGSPALADHELAVADLVAAEVPEARITLSYEFGRPGLREREREAILNASLRPQAERLADLVASWLPGIPVYFARTGGGLVSAHYFRRYPLVCARGATAAALRGGQPEADRPDAAVAFGATLAVPVAEVERIVQARGRAELDRELGDARDEALTRVVSAGAVPGSARIEEMTVNPVSYLPDGLYRVRVTAAGSTP
ncbi:hypothetical protein [Nonomuraea aurantiaca]|uniref:hypothetical protein n=1 Tax=Nonomuraea aurantiaca TaxID=2878562 RepID=UPI001CDA1CF6|nr:hypothetical protein [Nonomuraea aurantiaca]MCA2225515.1 hypothetical protein [Nonomuraea aurantiaca]